MRILFVSDNFPPESNAPASRLHEHARRWVRAGHEVTVVTGTPNFPEGRPYPGYDNRWHQVEQLDGIRVVRVKTYMAENRGVARRTLDHSSFMLGGVLAGAIEGRPDVVVATSPQFFAALAGHLLARRWRAPFVLEVRDLWPASIAAVGAMRDGPLLRALERLELFLYARASAVVVVTEASRADLIGRGVAASKVHVIPNGADLDWCRPGVVDAALCRQHDLSGKLVVGYIGTLGMAHALDRVLDAAELTSDASHVLYLIAGAGAERARLEARLASTPSSNVLLLPRQPKERVSALWGACDVGLITLADRPLFSSVVPSKLFEAMGHGVPVLISVPEGEATALVRREGCGVVVPPANPRALADAVRELARSPAQIAELGARALAAAPRHSRERHAAHMLRLLEQVAGSGSGLRARASSPALSPVRGLRSLLYRGGRKLYQHARREGANDPRQNGEYRLLSAALERAGNEPLVLLDVGAHRGDWSAEAERQLERLGLRGEIHAFEPTPETHCELSRRFAGERRVVARALALSDREGTLPLYVAGALAGTNSLEDQGLGPALDVQATTVDRFLSEQHIERVTFLKCDAEGHDLAVLRGGAGSLAAGRVDVWQFEYNARWIYARAFLRDVFELARGTPYSIGKVHRHGVELFESWHPELERYFETNFVLLRRGSPFESLGQPVRFDRSNSPR